MPRAAKQKLTAQEIAKRARAEEREFHKKKMEEARVEDLRDDAISLILGSKTADERHRLFQAIEERGGATVRTLEAWFDKKVTNPQAPTLRATLRAMDMDLGIVSGRYKRRS